MATSGSDMHRSSRQQPGRLASRNEELSRAAPSRAHHPFAYTFDTSMSQEDDNDNHQATQQLMPRFALSQDSERRLPSKLDEPVTAAVATRNYTSLKDSSASTTTREPVRPSRSAFSSPGRRNMAVQSEPGTPTSNPERVQAYLKQRHAHALLRTQQFKAKHKSYQAMSSRSNNQEEKKEEPEAGQGSTAALETHTSRLLSMLPSKTPSRTPPVAQHLEDFSELMNSTDDDTFTTDPELSMHGPIVLEFQKPTLENLKTVTPSPSRKSGVVSSHSIQAAHLAHRHAHPDEFPSPSQDTKSTMQQQPEDDDIRHPPLLQRHYQSPALSKRQTRSDKDRSTFLTADSVSAPSPPISSRVQAIKHKLWDDERLKPQTEAWQKAQRVDNKGEAIAVTTASRQVPARTSEPAREFSRDRRSAPTSTAPAIPSESIRKEPMSSIRKELKPPADERRSMSRLDSKLARHARSLSPHASRSTKSGATTTSTVFSSRFIDAAVRTTPDRSVHSKTSALRNPTRASMPVTKDNKNNLDDKLPDNKSYSDLVAQLQTVNRSDAAAALAQIDAILAQQGVPRRQSVPQYQALPVSPKTQARHVKEEADGDEEDDDDDETSVSSITNPSYGHGSRNVMATRATPSSGGKPRPSGLNAYSNFQSRKVKDELHEAIQVDPKGSADKKKKKKRSGTPPPASIETRSTSTLLRSNMAAAVTKDRFTAADIYQQRQTKTASPEADNSPSCESDSISAATSILGRVETCLSPIDHGAEDPVLDVANTKEIAEKISRWDQLTDTFSRVFSFDGKGTAKDDLTSKRSHPWDGTKLHNRVHLRETSMEAADGLEAKIVTPETSTSNYSSATPSRSFREVDVSVGHSFVNKSGSWGRVASRDCDSPVAAEKLIVHNFSYDNLSYEFDMLSNSLTGDKYPWVAMPSSPFFPNKSSSGLVESEQKHGRRSSHRHYDDDEHEASNPFAESLPRSTNPFDNDIEHDTARRLMEKSVDRWSTNPFDESSGSGRSEGRIQFSRGRQFAAVSRVPRESFEQSSNESSREARSFGRRHEYGNMSASFDENERSSIEVALAPPPQKRSILRRMRELAPPQYDESIENGDDLKRTSGVKSFLKRRNSGSAGLSTGSMNLSSNVSLRSRLSERSKRTHSMERRGSRTEKKHVESATRGRGRSKSPARMRARSLDERRIRNPSIARKFGRLLRVYDYDADPLYDELKKLNI